MVFVFVVVVVALVQDRIFGDDYSFMFDFSPNSGCASKCYIILYTFQLNFNILSAGHDLVGRESHRFLPGGHILPA